MNQSQSFLAWLSEALGVAELQRSFDDLESRIIQHLVRLEEFMSKQSKQIEQVLQLAREVKQINLDFTAEVEGLSQTLVSEITQINAKLESMDSEDSRLSEVIADLSNLAATSVGVKQKIEETKQRIANIVPDEFIAEPQIDPNLNSPVDPGRTPLIDPDSIDPDSTAVVEPVNPETQAQAETSSELSPKVEPTAEFDEENE